jgi:hypothetical protein
MFQRDARYVSTCLQRAALVMSVLFSTPLIAGAATFDVTSMLDLPDDAPGDGFCATATGVCTLRAAIMEANATFGTGLHTINLPAGLYQLTRNSDGGLLAGLDEDDRQGGAAPEGALGNDAWNDLDIGVNLDVIGAGENDTIIEGSAIDRVFHILHPGAGRPSPRIVRFVDLTIRNGHTLQRGAGVFVERVSEAHFEHVTLAENQGTHLFHHDGVTFIGLGGGIYSQAHDLFVTACTFRNNFAVVGGGLAVIGGWATIADTTFEGNEARSPGSGSPGIVGGRPGMGGGIAVLESEALLTFMVMTGSTLNNNRANLGGGLGAFGGFSVVNSTFSDNTAVSYGGGAFVRTPIGANISNFEFVTIANNAAFLGGGIMRETAPPPRPPLNIGRLLASRTIVSDNTPENCAGPGRPLSNGHNLEDGNTCGFTRSTDLHDTDPRLGPLMNNGGPTATRALLTLSPAIGAAEMSSWRFDQRGVSRPQGAAMDIGAFEYQMPRLRIPVPIPDRFGVLFGFSVRVEVQGTGGATLKDIVPAIDGMKLSVKFDKSGTSAIVSASGLKIDVNALKKLTNEKQPALFHVAADSLREGSDFLIVSDQRYDATLAGVTKLPMQKQ